MTVVCNRETHVWFIAQAGPILQAVLGCPLPPSRKRKTTMAQVTSLALGLLPPPPSRPSAQQHQPSRHARRWRRSPRKHGSSCGGCTRRSIGTTVKPDGISRVWYVLNPPCMCPCSIQSTMSAQHTKRRCTYAEHVASCGDSPSDRGSVRDDWTLCLR